MNVQMVINGPNLVLVYVGVDGQVKILRKINIGDNIN